MSKQVDPAVSGCSTAELNKKLTEDEVEALIRAAQEARLRAYCPYSEFAVGAALLTEDGSIIKGCNVENVSYGLTICAERSAVCSAVAQGHRNFTAVAIVADQGERFVGPCGACRQVLAEFGGSCEVYLARLTSEYIKTTVGKLLPDGFTPDWVTFKKQNK